MNGVGLRSTAALLLVVVAGLVVLATSGGRGRLLPNIVVVLADDLGYGDPGCYNDQSRIPTPHLDRLAAEGTRFTDAHAPSSVCTPTRYGILTGRYAWRTGLERGVLLPWDPPLIGADERTLPEVLRRAGYTTACLGKWHLGWNWALRDRRRVRDVAEGATMDPDLREEVAETVDLRRSIPGGPLDHGFDSYFWDDVPNFPPYAWIDGDRITVPPTVDKPEDVYGEPGPMAPGWAHVTVLPTLAQRAGAWIDAHARRRSRRPFFLYLSLTSPHTPIVPATRWVGASAAGDYGDFVVETDWVLGVVLDALERNGLERDTIVVFTSDNGSPQKSFSTAANGSVVEDHGHDPSRPWRGVKSDAWEGGHRVPFVVRWPGLVPAGRVCDEPMVHTDLFRTLCGFAGVRPGRGVAADSFDLGSVWLGARPVDAGPVRDHLIHHSGPGVFAIRVGSEKLIDGVGAGTVIPYEPPADAPEGELYDLAVDPGETTNLYPERPEAVARLRARLQQVRRSGTSRGLRAGGSAGPQ